MANEVDISERWLLENYPKAFAVLLKDHASGQNIYWATESYVERGEGFGFFDPITIDKIKDDTVIRPRARKSAEEQTRRVKDKAEVFTPSWICNAQNNLVDEAWFGRPDVFNREIIREDGTHDWEITERPIKFGKSHNNRKKCSWQQYVEDRRLEITCGEAPYLISRYDTVTGEPIPLEKRIGMLDRKLQVVSENESEPQKWLKRAQKAIKAIYGFEWQGDSLLLAREAALLTVLDYFFEKFPDEPGNAINRQKFSQMVNDCAHFISCNLWQMDGLNFVLPGTAKKPFIYKELELPEKPDTTGNMFPEEEIARWEAECERLKAQHPTTDGERKKAPSILEALRQNKQSPEPAGIPAVVYDWFPKREKMFFSSIVNKKDK